MFTCFSFQVKEGDLYGKKVKVVSYYPDRYSPRPSGRNYSFRGSSLP